MGLLSWLGFGAADVDVMENDSPSAAYKTELINGGVPDEHLRTVPAEKKADPVIKELSSQMFYGDDSYYNTPWTPINYKRFNGEKNQGELGLPTLLAPDYRALRIRAHEVNLTSDIIQIIAGKFFFWVVGSGLKMQAQPNRKVLELEKVIKPKENKPKTSKSKDKASKVKDPLRDFAGSTEAYWHLYADSTMADEAELQTLNEMASDAFTSAFLGGDCLCVARLDESLNITVQIIDGQHVVQPSLSEKYFDEAKERGNVILHGIEIDEKGRHVAFYVVKQTPDNAIGEYERIEAIGKETGLKMAWMIYGKKHRIDHKRGIPVISSIIETVKKLDRYTEASISSAEERAKLPWTIQHNQHSDGENPMIANITRTNGATAQETGYELAGPIAKNIQATENKTVYNLPIGAEFKTVNSAAEVQFEPFWNAIFIQAAAAIGVPPEVALQKYSSNYSASRAAIKAWEYLIRIYRKKHVRQFYKPIYDLWLYVHILRNKIEAPGYIKAKDENNRYVTEAYSGARFYGEVMPNIDPLKESKAIREQLGDMRAGIPPLITYSMATEQLGNGEFNENYENWKEENEMIADDMPPEDQENTTQVRFNE